MGSYAWGSRESDVEIVINPGLEIFVEEGDEVL